MNTSGDRLRILLRECHLTATDFAANRKITPQHVNNWFKRGVPMARIDEVAELLTVNARWLRSGDGPKHPNESANENTGDDTRMAIQQTRNVLRGDVEIQIYMEIESTHGVGKTVLSEAPGQKIRLPLQVLQTMGIDPKNCMCVAMVGNSMADKIQDGSILGVDRELTQVIDGEIYALEHGAHSTPSGHPVHQHPATYSTLIRPGSRSAATQVRIVSLKSLSSSISLRACASIHPSVRSDKRYVPAGRGSRRPRSDRRSAHAICPQASGW
ncbi:HTH-type transcriptional regulator PrtR [Pseudomonas syringae pv. actinidiae]|nr:HTH-type transcriptional regulator PrtR [Pseudomonas syringae pv. actinidiae]